MTTKTNSFGETPNQARRKTHKLLHIWLPLPDYERMLKSPLLQPGNSSKNTEHGISINKFVCEAIKEKSCD